MQGRFGVLGICYCVKLGILTRGLNIDRLLQVRYDVRPAWVV